MQRNKKQQYPTIIHGYTTLLSSRRLEESSKGDNLVWYTDGFKTQEGVGAEMYEPSSETLEMSINLFRY